jgi:LPXTG-motif cell wall-anchored protein
MKRFAVLAVVACLGVCALTGTGRANIIYDATGTFTDGATLSGTVTFNDSGGLVSTALQVTLGGTVVIDTSLNQPAVGPATPFTGSDGNTYDGIVGGSFAPGPLFSLIYLAADIPGSSPVPIVPAVPLPSGGNAVSIYFVTSVVNLSTGELTPETVAEPASLTLLGIGAVGLLGYGWRKRRRAVA